MTQYVIFQLFPTLDHSGHAHCRVRQMFDVPKPLFSSLFSLLPLFSPLGLFSHTSVHHPNHPCTPMPVHSSCKWLAPKTIFSLDFSFDFYCKPTHSHIWQHCPPPHSGLSSHSRWDYFISSSPSQRLFSSSCNIAS